MLRCPPSAIRCFVITAVIGAALTGTADAGPVKAIMADKAADMVGVNTHLNYRDTPYYSRYEDLIKPRLSELGVRHIRDNPSNEKLVKDRYAELAKNGIKLLLINWDQPRGYEYAKSLNTDSGVKVVEAVEPPNEKDDWRDRMKDHIAEMWRLYKQDPATSDILILGPSYANTRNSPGSFVKFWPEAANYMDKGNTHDYCGTYPEGPRGGGWGFGLDDALAEYKKLCSDKPIWATENGYKNSKSVRGHPAVTEKAAAKYFPRQFLLHLSKGVERFYIYQFINCKPNNAHENFGILNDDGTPRKQFLAVKNFIGLFEDPGPDFETGSLDYTLSGDMTDIHQVLLQKRDGRFYLATWLGAESSVYAETDDKIADLTPKHRTLRLDLKTRIVEYCRHYPSSSDRRHSRHSEPNGVSDTLVFPVSDAVGVFELIPAKP